MYYDIQSVNNIEDQLWWDDGERVRRNEPRGEGITMRLVPGRRNWYQMEGHGF